MATIIDIARETGFSVMTVSRVFNTPELVKASTRNKILEVAEKMNYHPNNIARSLARKCTNIVFVYVPKGLHATEQFVSQTITAIGERLGECGYSFLLSRTLPENESFDGIIMMGLSHDEERAMLALKCLGKPVVLYGNSDNYPAWVDVDNYSGEAQAVEYLLEKGYRHIGAICAPQNMHYGEERLNGYKDALRESGREIDESIISIGEANELGGYDCTLRLLEGGGKIDSIVCATDTMAIGCLRALREKGISVPNDIAVVGFDGFGHENIASPKLTTVRQPLYEVGVKLADTILELINGDEPKQIKILPRLVEGQSA